MTKLSKSNINRLQKAYERGDLDVPTTSLQPEALIEAGYLQYQRNVGHARYAFKRYTITVAGMIAIGKFDGEADLWASGD